MVHILCVCSLPNFSLTLWNLIFISTFSPNCLLGITSCHCNVQCPFQTHSQPPLHFPFHSPHYIFTRSFLESFHPFLFPALCFLCLPANFPILLKFPTWLLFLLMSPVAQGSVLGLLLFLVRPQYIESICILRDASTLGWWLTDLQLTSWPLLKVYSHISDCPLVLFTWKSSHCLRFNSL